MSQAHRNSGVTVAGILLGAGLGGFVDGITLHQIAQWHNMLSARLPPHNMENMRFNMRWDGIFHAGTWLVTVLGLGLLWSAVQRPARLPSTRHFVGSLIFGWGLFNLVEGLIDHQLLGLHHVREVPNYLAYDLTFLAVGGVLLLLVGWLLMRKP